MPIPSPHLLSLLHRAQASPFGIAVQVEEGQVASVSNMLRHCRQLARDPELFNLRISASPHNPTSEIWIIKRRGSGDMPVDSNLQSILPLRVED